MIKFSKTLKVIVAASVIFFSATALMAEKSQSSESETIDQLCHNFAFNEEIASHDPFKPVVTKKVIVPVKIERQPEIVSDKIVEKTAPSLKLKVFGICGNDGVREAVVQFENDEHVIKSGQVVNGKFKVVAIDANKVVIYSIREARRATFALAEN